MAEELTREEILADPENLKCTCPQKEDGTYCEYRGRCKECTAYHRFKKGLPACMRSFAVVADA